MMAGVLLLKYVLFFLSSVRLSFRCVHSQYCVTYGHLHTSTWQKLTECAALPWLQRAVYILTHHLSRSPPTLTHSSKILSDPTSYKQVASKPSPWDWLPDKMIKTKSHLCSLKGQQAGQDHCRATDGQIIFWLVNTDSSHPSVSCVAVWKKPQPKEAEPSNLKYSAHFLGRKIIKIRTSFCRWQWFNEITCM